MCQPRACEPVTEEERGANWRTMTKAVRTLRRKLCVKPRPFTMNSPGVFWLSVWPLPSFKSGLKDKRPAGRTSRLSLRTFTFHTMPDPGPHRCICYTELKVSIGSREGGMVQQAKICRKASHAHSV